MPAPPCGNYGDVNDDGEVNMIDVMMVQDHVNNPIAHPFTDEQKRRADVNGDGKVNILDLTLISDYVTGTITTFPVCGVTPPPTEITCNSPTPNFSSGCELLKYADFNDDHFISGPEYTDATHGISREGLTLIPLTYEEQQFVRKAYREYDGDINALCPGCYATPPPPPPVICTPGETRCYADQVLETCKSDGTGWIRSTCYSGTICKDGKCVPVVAPPPTPPGNETRTTSLTEGNHSIQVSLSGYDTLNATINVSSTGVTCVSGPCNTQGPPGVTTSGWTVTTYLKSATTVSDVCSWINSIGGWENLQWTSHILEAYYVYIGASGHSIGFSPVTWNDVLGLYYYYINDPSAGNAKIGCGT